MEKDELGWACVMYGGGGVPVVKPEKKDHLEDVDLEGRIILK
jgi:carbamate kinase